MPDNDFNCEEIFFATLAILDDRYQNVQANAGFHDLIGEAGRDITGLSILGILEQNGVSRDQVVGLFDTAFDGQSGATTQPVYALRTDRIKGSDVLGFWLRMDRDPPDRRGFGMQMICQLLPGQLEGTATRTFTPTGLHYRLKVDENVTVPVH